MCDEVIYKEEACAIMGSSHIYIIRPIIELGIRRLEKTLIKPADRVTIEVLCQHRHTFIDPAEGSRVLVPGNQMLKFMGKGTVIVGTARNEVIKAHIEHFALVAVRKDTGRILILGIKVSTSAVAQTRRIEDG